MNQTEVDLLIDHVARMNNPHCSGILDSLNHYELDSAPFEVSPVEAITYFSLDSAIVGITLYQGVFVLVYSYDLLVEEFISQGMERECAEEWVDYNILGAYLGTGTPVVVIDDELITNRGGDSYTYITVEVDHIFPGATLYSLGKPTYDG